MKSRYMKILLAAMMILLLVAVVGCGGGGGNGGDPVDSEDIIDGEDIIDVDDGEEDVVFDDEDWLFRLDEMREIYPRLSEAFDDRTLSEMDYAAVVEEFFGGVEASKIENEFDKDWCYWYIAGSNEENYVRVIFYSEEDGGGVQGISKYYPDED